MLTVIAILFLGGVALGGLWNRSLLFLLGFSVLIGFGFAICIGDWSFIRSPAYLWQNIIYISLTLGGYFAMIVGPIFSGTLAGYLLRMGVCRK